MSIAGESSGKKCGDCDGKVAGESQRKVGLIYDERMCKHETPGENHLERPDRIRVIWEKLQLAGVTQRCVLLSSSKAEDKHLQLVHTKDHVNLVKNISAKHKDYRSNKIASQLSSVYLNGGSSEAAYLAAGSVVKVAEKVAEGELDCGFAIVRPPGHHAEAAEAMGFCLFNNVAVAASYLLNERPDLGIKKILIVDWDIHHGNGTQKMFWKDPRVLFFSVHRHEYGSFYPASDYGDYNMVGEGPGEGFNINVPWDQGRCGDADYLAAWDHILIPVAREFNPDIILLSAGFDAAIGDPLGGCRVTPYGYSVMLKKLMEFAHGKIVLALEGGYNLDSIAKSSLACVQVLLEDKKSHGSSEAYPFESTWRVIKAVRKRLCAYWPSLADELSPELFNQKTPTPIILMSRSDSETEDGLEGADYRFSYNYPKKGLAFTLDNVACAKLASNIPGGFTQFPSPDSLSEASFYSSWAQESFKAIGAVNRMVGAYDDKLKKAEKAESEARALFVKERRNSDSYRKDLDKSASELKSFKEKFDTETARLRASRDSYAKAEKEKADGYRVYADRLRRHILSQEAARKDLELLVQITGTRECLEGLMGVGVPIPEEKMKQLTDDEVKYHEIVNQFEIVDLLDGDLEEPAAAGPSRVVADGGDRSPADQ